MVDNNFSRQVKRYPLLLDEACYLIEDWETNSRRK
jgi:hypothetical protein